MKDLSFEKRIEHFVRLNAKLRDITATEEIKTLNLTRNLNAMQLYIICIIAEHEPCNMRLIAELTGLTPGSITAAVDRLMQLKLVKRLRSETDRRVVYALLTKAGNKIYQSRQTDVRNIAQKFFSQIDEAEQIQLLNILEKLVPDEIRDSN